MSFLRPASSGLRACLNSASRTSVRTLRTTPALADSSILNNDPAESESTSSEVKSNSEVESSGNEVVDRYNEPAEPIYSHLKENGPNILKTWPISPNRYIVLQRHNDTGVPCVDVRRFLLARGNGKSIASKNGLLLTIEQWKELGKVYGEVEAEIKKEGWWEEPPKWIAIAKPKKPKSERMERQNLPETESTEGEKLSDARKREERKKREREEKKAEKKARKAEGAKTGMSATLVLHGSPPSGFPSSLPLTLRFLGASGSSRTDAKVEKAPSAKVEAAPDAEVEASTTSDAEIPTKEDKGI